MVPELDQIVRECRDKGQLVEGPHIALFEQEFAQFLGGGHVRAVSTEYGRMGLYFILKALDLPEGSEIIVPALTFWVVPEITRVAGLKPVFVDVDPATFTMSPEAAERAITPNTRAILPTHLYGMACDLDPILALARKHNLKVVEDCAHSLGAEYKGRKVGTLGDASFFSFQAFKPLNTYGGGLAWTRDADVAKRVKAMADAGVTHVYECGPGKVLAGLVRRIDAGVQCYALADRASLEQALAAALETAAGTPRRPFACYARGPGAALALVSAAGLPAGSMIEIGIVTAANGQKWYEIELTGVESHAGPTPMNRRKDALVGAARIVELVNQIGHAHDPAACATALPATTALSCATLPLRRAALARALRRHQRRAQRHGHRHHRQDCRQGFHVA